ncbi:restriction endonuclease subunit S [Aliarcobacter cryaerophilus]|uniref:restriction endonuclease subunit S n=1 Tax=Aliarcobacter cryaerophilus TaxID=28198 RepID=UPI003DA40A08
MSNVPKLRFKEFSGEWEEKKLKNFALIYDGTHQTPKYMEAGIPFVSVENINAIENTEKYISKEDFDKYKIKPKKNDILMTRITAGIIGATAVVKNDEPLAYYVSLALIRLKENQTINITFLSLYINSIYFKKELHKRIIHTAFPKKINLGDIGECHTFLPSKQEQEKIASFLTSVDTKIEQLTKKEALLTSYKKGVMQKIFNQEIRFKADDGSEFCDWEEKKLGDLCNITTGKLDANAMVENGQYRFYTCAKDYFLIDNYAFDTDALLISGNGANVGYIHHYKGKFNAYQRTYVLDGFKDNIFFLKYVLDKYLYKRIMKEKNEGNTPYIVMGTLTNMVIIIPCLEEEQTKIANFLSSIDSKIEQVQKQLNSTKEFKKALLQQMFV